MRGIQTTVAGRVLSVALSGALLLGNLAAGAGVAFADTQVQPSGQSGASAVTASAPKAPPTVVRELTDKRTETADTYLLSDGSYRMVISAEAVNYSASDGSMQPIDTSLVPASGDPGTLKSAATPVTSVFGDGCDGAPVSLSTPSWSASIDFLGSVESDPLDLADQAVYSNVATATDLTYQPLSSGVKETLLLHAPSAPATYRFKVNLTGLEVRDTPGGSPAAYLPGSDVAVLSLGSLTVWDSSHNGAIGEPAFCASASSTVEAVPGGAVVTYRIPREWLADPTRVFPVRVDPTLTQAIGRDTFVKDAANATNTAYGSLDFIRAGKADSTTGHSRGYVWFDTSSLASATISAATLGLTCSYHYDPNASANQKVYVRTNTADWDDGTTWNTKPGMGSTILGYTNVTGTGAYSFNVGAAAVQGWVNSPATNYGLVVYESEGGDQEKFLNEFWAREHSVGTAPKLTVTYTQNAPGAVTTGGASTAAMDWFRQADSNGDGVPDTNDDFPRQGRGSVNLTWTPSSGAAGYAIWWNDGNTASNGGWRKVGLVPGSSSASWSSDGAGIYPSDTWISQAATGSNAGCQAISPSSYSRTTSFNAKDSRGNNLGGTGIVASDGTYLYTQRWGSYPGSTAWVKTGSGLKGTTAGAFVATIGPTLDTSYFGELRSGFYLGGVLYNGSTTAESNSDLWGYSIHDGSGASAGEVGTQILTLSKPMLDTWRGTDAELSQGTLMASDGTYIYGAAMSLGQGGGYDGWKVRVWNEDGEWIKDVLIPGTSYYTDGFVVDGKNAYFVEWTATDSARVTRASLATGRVNGQWTIDQGASEVINGSYDPANNCFWMGGLGSTAGLNKVHRFMGPGLDLRDNPNPLYKTVGPTGALSNSMGYAFKVVPYNAATSDSSLLSSCATITATLQNRTISAFQDPSHTDATLGHILAAPITAGLDKGSLRLDVADIGIDSWGPGVGVVRHYDSQSAGSENRMAGWRFNFDESVATASASVVNYTDDVGDVHSFVATQGAYMSPAGFYGTLSRDDENWIITDKDGRGALRYDLATGHVVSATDRNGNQATYDWSSTALTMTAANGHQIVVSLDATGDVTGATYQTASGLREVAYDSAAGIVTHFPGVQGQEYRESYGYSDALLASVTVTSPASADLGTWTFGYEPAGKRRLTVVGYPGSVSDSGLRTLVSYPATGQAVLADFATVRGTLDTTVTRTYKLNPTGTVYQSSNSTSSGDASVWTTFSYGPNNELIETDLPTGAKDYRTVDASGNVLFEWDEQGRNTANYYDQRSQLIRSVDPVGRESVFTYDANGNLLVTGREFRLRSFATTTRTYNASGTITSEYLTASDYQDAANDINITYDGFASSGAWTSKTMHGVRLGKCPNGSYITSDLTTQRGIDSFGNVVWSTDTEGHTTETNVYQPTTRMLEVSSTDASGTDRLTAYDAYGRQRETSVVAGGLGCNREVDTRDAFGRPVSTVWPGDTGSARVLTAAYDQLGRETSANDSKAGAADKTLYDAAGRVTQQWAAGSDPTSDAASSRATYDVYGRAVQTYGVNETSPTVLTYNADGSVATKTYPTGRKDIYTYDAVGHKIKQQIVEEATITAYWTYGIDGTCFKSVGYDGAVTWYTYDAFGREIGSTVDASGNDVVTEYSQLGKPIYQHDSDDTETFYEYDGNGNQLAQTQDGKTSTMTYDGCGRVLQRTSPSSTVSYAYDELGRVVRTQGRDDAGNLLADQRTVYDLVSRPVETSDAVTGLRVSTAYPASPGSGSSTTRTRPSGTHETSYKSATGGEEYRTVMFNGGAPGTSGASLSVRRDVVTTDAAGRELTSDHRWSWTDGVFTTYTGDCGLDVTYDNKGALKTLDGSGWNGSLVEGGVYAQGASYSYTKAGALSSATYHYLFGATNESKTYTYDNVDRLSTWTDTAGNVASATYDNKGHVATVTRKVSGTNRVTTLAYSNATSTGYLKSALTASGSQRYFSADSQTGARTAESLNATPGTAGSSAVATYTWSPEIRLLSVGKPGGRSSNYSYDIAGQRTRSVVVSGSITTTTTYIYGGLSLLSLTASDSTGASWTVEYARNDAGTPFAGVYREGTSTVVSVPFEVVTNEHGDVVELVDIQSFQALALYRYDAWGTPNTPQSTAIPVSNIDAGLASRIANRQPLRYAGYAYDGDTGLYYCSARYYDPSTCQFLSKDPMRADDDGLSSYMYCANDPVNDSDLSGLGYIMLPDGHGGYVYIYINDGEDTVNGLPVAPPAAVVQDAISHGDSHGNAHGSVSGVAAGSHVQVTYHYSKNGISSSGSSPGAAVRAWWAEVKRRRELARKARLAEEARQKKLRANMVYRLLEANLRAQELPFAFQAWATDKIFGPGASNDIAGGLIGMGAFGGMAAEEVEMSVLAEEFVASDLRAATIGSQVDLKAATAAGERFRTLNLPNMGTPRANWKQNSGVLRAEMSRGLPIADRSFDPATGELTNYTPFIRAERMLLTEHGWSYDPVWTQWTPPSR